MKKFKTVLKDAIVKHGNVIATFAFIFVSMAANSSCFLPFYEPEEPAGVDKFKKFNR